MHFVLRQDQWERWLQTVFTFVLWTSILFLEVAAFYALECEVFETECEVLKPVIVMGFSLEYQRSWPYAA